MTYSMASLMALLPVKEPLLPRPVSFDRLIALIPNLTCLVLSLMDTLRHSVRVLVVLGVEPAIARLENAVVSEFTLPHILRVIF